MSCKNIFKVPPASNNSWLVQLGLFGFELAAWSTKKSKTVVNPHQTVNYTDPYAGEQQAHILVKHFPSFARAIFSGEAEHYDFVCSASRNGGGRLDYRLRLMRVDEPSESVSHLDIGHSVQYVRDFCSSQKPEVVFHFFSPDTGDMWLRLVKTGKSIRAVKGK